MSLFMHYVFVVHSRLVLSRLPLAKAFLRAILTVNTYPFDWHHRREYVDVSLNIASVRAPLHRHESLPPPPPLLPPRFVPGGLTNRRLIAPLRSGRHWQRSHPFLTSPFGRHPHCNPALLEKISLPSFELSCFVSRFLL